MASNGLSAHIRIQDDIAILMLSGDIDGLAEDALITAYQRAENWKPESILLDMSDVQYINSTGIAVLVGLLSRARKHQTRLMICGLNEHYQEIFRVTRLADFIPIFPDETAALEQAVT
jgi:anti-sigma B factor antagonist